MARAYYLGILITCVIAVVPILFSVWVCHEAAARTGYAGTWSYCFKTSLGVLLLLAAALLVQCRKVKVVPILCILVGAPILLYNMFPILMIWAGNKAERKPMHYDYTDRIGSVESIDLVRLDDYARESSEGECLDYTILKTLDPEQYAPILRDLAGLRYLMVMDPPALSKGRIMILIRFSPGEDDLRYAFLGSSNPGQVTWNGTEYRLTYYNCVAYEAWDELASKYFPGAPLR